MTDPTWTQAPLVALDLEVTGAQDRGDEAILEIAAVPIVGGLPAMGRAYETLVNPGRPVPRRPWISPGLTDAVLSQAPPPDAVGLELAPRLADRYLVGHNVGVDWRLMHRHYPDIRPAGVIDTLRMARRIGATARSLTALVDRYALRERVGELVPHGRAHRALWDTVAAALLLQELIAVSGRPRPASMRSSPAQASGSAITTIPGSRRCCRTRVASRRHKSSRWSGPTGPNGAATEFSCGVPAVGSGPGMEVGRP